MNDLVGNSFTAEEGGAEAFMTADNLAQRGL
jgi:hypothetical protein